MYSTWKQCGKQLKCNLWNTHLYSPTRIVIFTGVNYWVSVFMSYFYFGFVKIFFWFYSVFELSLPLLLVAVRLPLKRSDMTAVVCSRVVIRFELRDFLFGRQRRVVQYGLSVGDGRHRSYHCGQRILLVVVVDGSLVQRVSGSQPGPQRPQLVAHTVHPLVISRGRRTFVNLRIRLGGSRLGGGFQLFRHDLHEQPRVGVRVVCVVDGHLKIFEKAKC